MSEPGRIRPPYGGATHCPAIDCGHSELNEESGVYLHTDRETGKIIPLCGACSMAAQMYASLRYPLVPL